MTKTSILLSCVVPVYNESLNIEEFYNRLLLATESFSDSLEFIFVDDGSSDGSLELLKSIGDARVKIISLVRNSGHMSALDAGHRAALGKWVVTLDSDLQHPPELIPEMLETAIKESVDIVFTRRGKSNEETLIKSTGSRAYYSVMRKLTKVNIPENSADFRLISQRVNNVIKSIPPGFTVFRILLPSLGFPHAVIDYVPEKRHAGDTKYSFKKMMTLAFESALNFSEFPLRIASRLGILLAAIAGVMSVFTFIEYLAGNTVSGWTSTNLTMTFLFGMLFLMLGISNLYISKIFQILKGLPQYIIDEIYLSADKQGEKDAE